MVSPKIYMETCIDRVPQIFIFKRGNIKYSKWKSSVSLFPLDKKEKKIDHYLWWSGKEKKSNNQDNV